MASILPPGCSHQTVSFLFVFSGAITPNTVHNDDDESVTDMDLNMNDPESLIEQCIEFLNNKDCVNHLILLAEKSGSSKSSLSFS